jgi:hypothetical protein
MISKKQAMSVDIFGTTLTITFSNGKDLAVDVSKLTPEIQRMAMLHGIKQKLVDAAAIARNTDNGASVGVEQKYKAVAEVHARLTADKPSWNKERVAAGTPANANNLLVRALMQMTGRDKAYVDDFLTSKTKDERAALKRNPRVLAIIAELSAVTVSGGVDTDELLEELGADPSDDDSDDDTSALAFERAPATIAQQIQEAVQKPSRARKTKVAA